MRTMHRAEQCGVGFSELAQRTGQAAVVTRLTCLLGPGAHKPESVCAPWASAAGCAVCGVPGRLRCGRCKTRRYCGKAHQTQDWPAHKRVCEVGAWGGPPPGGGDDGGGGGGDGGFSFSDVD